MFNAAELDVFKLLAVRNKKNKPMSRFGYKNIFLLRVSQMNTFYYNTNNNNLLVIGTKFKAI